MGNSEEALNKWQSLAKIKDIYCVLRLEKPARLIIECRTCKRVYDVRRESVSLRTPCKDCAEKSYERFPYKGKQLTASLLSKKIGISSQRIREIFNEYKENAVTYLKERGYDL